MAATLLVGVLLVLLVLLLLLVLVGEVVAHQTSTDYAGKCSESAASKFVCGETSGCGAQDGAAEAALARCAGGSVRVSVAAWTLRRIAALRRIAMLLLGVRVVGTAGVVALRRGGSVALMLLLLVVTLRWVRRVATVLLWWWRGSVALLRGVRRVTSIVGIRRAITLRRGSAVLSLLRRITALVVTLAALTSLAAVEVLS